jgi:hypothetical protein
MTLQEILKSQGLADDQINTIMGEMKQNKIFTAGEENLDIRYSKLKADHDNLTTQHGEATKLIDQLKAGTKDSEALQGKITSYEQQITQLQEQLKQTQLDAEIKVALLAAKATDVDYMTFRLKEKGELDLDKDGHIKGIDDRLAGLKTQYPTFFESGTAQRELQPHKLPTPDSGDKGMTKAELLKKPYAERAAYAQNNPEAYNTIMNS